MAHFDFRAGGSADLSAYYTKSQVDTLLAGATGSDPSRTEIEGAYKIAYATAYKDMLYDVNGAITAIDVWTTSAKSLKLFTKTFGYTGDKVTTITLHDERNGKSLTKTFTYVSDTLDYITTTFA